MSLSTVFQSYQDDGWVMMKGCVKWNPVYPNMRAGHVPHRCCILHVLCVLAYSDWYMDLTKLICIDLSESIK